MVTESGENPGKAPPGLAIEHGSANLMERYRLGDSRAAVQLFDRYANRLVSLARSRMSRGMRRRVDPEEVAQSAYRSFFVRAAAGGFDVGESGDLWRLLAQITLNKVRKQAERHTAARRDFRRDGGDGGAVLRRVARSAPEDAASLAEELRLVTERLSPEERLALSAYLRGDSAEAIARRIGRAPRTVRRALARARSLIERRLLSAPVAPNTSRGELLLANPLLYADYRLERLVGAGGIGKVYRATQLSTGETVAIKALRKDRQTDSRAVRQFLREAAVVERIDHPGIIGVRGLGRFPAGGYFLVMDYVEGGDLQKRINERELPAAEAVALIERVAEAIACSHAAGVIHCDLKPANLLIGRSGDVIVTDFGFAQILAEEESKAAIGGTFGYLAPELLEGRKPPTPAADIYSLGRILEQLLPARPSKLQRLCERCLAKDPNQRPQSAEAFLAQLRESGGREA